jgi:hypothetical protein
MDEYLQEHLQAALKTTGGNLLDTRKNNHSTVDKERSIDKEGSTIDKEGSTIDREGSTIDIEGSTIDMEGSTIDMEGSTIDKERSTLDKEGSTSDKEDHQEVNKPKVFMPTYPKFFYDLILSIFLFIVASIFVVSHL